MPFVFPRGAPREIWRLRCLLVVLLGIGFAGCGSEAPDAYSLDWFFGAESQFHARIEGSMVDSLRGEATFRTDAEDRLVGIELNKAGQSMRGLSIELEPRAPEARTYTAVEPGLMGVERTGVPGGFVAYLESAQGSYTAVRGTLEVTEASASSVRGRFDLWMRGTENGTGQISDLTVEGAFQAMPRGE